MAFALFEENGDLKSGTVLADNGASLQVELVTGRRAKVKASHIYLRFESPPAADLLPMASATADDIDLDFLWECAPPDEFAFEALAQEYFGDKPDAVQATALLTKLKAAPIYFQRKGRGRFRAAPSETVQAALAAVKKRQQRDELIAAFSAQLLQGELPAQIREQAAMLLVKPDKMSLEYKALEGALAKSGKAPERLLFELGAFESDLDLHMVRFCTEQFPYGRGFPAALESWQADQALARRLTGLPSSGSLAFSVDDSATTEIDDAFSVHQLDDGRYRVGIHIAVPALAITPDSDLDRIARERMSTVYMPGDKITMLAGGIVQIFSLTAGRDVPAMSLYFELDEEGMQLRHTYSVIERITVADNLRHDQLDDVVSEQALNDPQVPLPHGQALRVLWKLTLALLAERERVRGKPEPRFRSDFSFRIENGQVEISQRRRDAPLSRIVAEMMILANSEWGRLLADRDIAGIYRSQQGGRVRMSAQALPHEGLGVSQYIWSTSPLRRYIDLVNQRQLVAAIEQSAPPLTASSAELFSILPGFEARHSAYQDFQQRMERYWCMRWLDQQQRTRLPAVAVRDDMVRLVDVPLYFRVDGAPLVAPGRRLLIDLTAYDKLDLSVAARFVGLDESVQSLEDGADAGDELPVTLVAAPELSETGADSSVDSVADSVVDADAAHKPAVSSQSSPGEPKLTDMQPACDPSANAAPLGDV